MNIGFKQYYRLKFKANEIILDSSSPVPMLKSILRWREVPAERTFMGDTSTHILLRRLLVVHVVFLQECP